jgi:hypothetical protein
MPTPTNDIFGGQYTSINTNLGSTASTANTASTASTTSTASTASTASAQSGSLDSILGTLNQGAQIVGSIKYQRQQSGASARRQSLIAKCGRAPLVGRQRKDEYRKCKADYEASLLAPIGGGGIVGDENKNIGGGSSPMKFILIGVGILAIGAIAYLALKKK